jgi:hypothetical protein
MAPFSQFHWSFKIFINLSNLITDLIITLLKVSKKKNHVKKTSNKTITIFFFTPTHKPTQHPLYISTLNTLNTINPFTNHPVPRPGCYEIFEMYSIPGQNWYEKFKKVPIPGPGLFQKN